MLLCLEVNYINIRNLFGDKRDKDKKSKIKISPPTKTKTLSLGQKIKMNRRSIEDF